MPQFTYEAINEAGHTIKGEIEATDADMASPSVANQWTGNATMTRVTVGDFVGSYTIDSGSVTLAVIGGATEKGSDVYEFASELSNFSAYTSQKFQLYSQE